MKTNLLCARRGGGDWYSRRIAQKRRTLPPALVQAIRLEKERELDGHAQIRELGGLGRCLIKLSAYCGLDVRCNKSSRNFWSKTVRHENDSFCTIRLAYAKFIPSKLN